MNRINSFLNKLQPRKHKTQKEIDDQSIIGTNSDLPKYRILPNLRFAYALPLVIIFAGFGMYSIFFSKAASSCLTSTSSIQSAVASAAPGAAICVSPGSYGSLNLSGSHGGEVTLQPDPALDPTTTGKVSFAGINIAGSYITVKNFYITSSSINFAAGSSNSKAESNDITGSPGEYGVNINCGSSGCSNIVVTKNKIHDLTSTVGVGSGTNCTQWGGDGDALRLDQKWDHVTFSFNEITRVTQVSGDCVGHNDCLQEYASINSNNLIFDHNYIHDAQCEAFLIKDSPVDTVSFTNNLFLNVPPVGQFFDTNHITFQNNTFWNSNVLFRANSSGLVASVNNNVLQNGYGNGCSSCSDGKLPMVITASNNITGGTTSQFTDTATNDYRLKTNPSNIGVSWKPTDNKYGPVFSQGSTAPTTCSTKPGDTNNDQVVNITDIAEILKLYGQTNSTSCVDINKDKVINIADIATVLQNYGSTGQSSPSGESMPTQKTITSGGNNWEQVFADDFTTNVALGSFPAAIASKWSAYPDGTRDTFCNGVFYPSKVNSVANGVLNHSLHDETVTYTIWPGQEKAACPTAGTFTKQIRLGSALVPKFADGTSDQLYGRYAIRFKTDALPNYYAAWLLWPESEAWPRDGEIDWPEGALSGTMGGFVHWMNGTSGSDQQGCPSNTKFFESTAVNAWNTVVTEWAPGSVKFYVNNQLICTVTGSRVPSSPMHYVLQTETGDTAVNNWVDGNLQVDWVTIYKKL